MIQTDNIWISLLLILCFVIIYRFGNKKFKPGFVIPQKYIHMTNNTIWHIIKWIIIISICILPFEIKIPGEKTTTTTQNHIQIIWDVSLSMNADDIKPNRFTNAKQAIIQLINNLTGYDTSLITFSGIPFVRIPRSTNQLAVIKKIEQTNLSAFPPTLDFVGTALGNALLLGISNIQKLSDADQNIIVLITDGDANKGSNPIQALSIAQQMNIKIFSIGIGDTTTTIGTDKIGNLVTTKINRSLLQTISDKTNGSFYMIKSKDDFAKAISDIIRDNTSKNSKIAYNMIDINKYILYITLLFLIIFIGINLYNIGRQLLYKKDGFFYK